jgi:hypothetical protein
MIRASDFKALERNTLRGFLTLTLEPSGLVLRDCSLHKMNEKEWIGLPGKPQLDKEGRHRADDKGKKLYVPVVELKDKAAYARFQEAALVAVHALLGERQQ